MAGLLRRPLSLALGLVATTTLGGCYYGDMTSAGYGGGYACSADYYDYDPYAYADGYGYDCYDSSDYGSGFASIGFGGGRSEEHTSELPSLIRLSYAVFCLKKKKRQNT